MKPSIGACWDRFSHDAHNMTQFATTLGQDTLQPKRFSTVANTPKDKLLPHFTDDALADAPDILQVGLDTALCETAHGFMPADISTRIADDIALSMSGLPQKPFWKPSLGRSGGSSDQGGQAKSRACRGRNPQNTQTQAHRVSILCLQELAAAHRTEQDRIGPFAQSSAEHGIQNRAAGTYQRCQDLQRSPTEDNKTDNTRRQTPSPHRRGGATNAADTVDANVRPFGPRLATTTGIHDELATTFNDFPLLRRGFVSLPTTAKASQETLTACVPVLSPTTASKPGAQEEWQQQQQDLLQLDAFTDRACFAGASKRQSQTQTCNSICPLRG